MDEKESPSTRRRKERTRRCSFFWKVITFVWTLTIQTSIVLSYCLIGAFLFRSLESKPGSKSADSSSTTNQSVVGDVHKLRSNTVLKLWNITDQFNVLYKENWTSLVAKEMEIFQSEIIHSIKNDPETFIWDEKIINVQNKEINTSSPKWSLQKSFLYSFSIITTMGKLPKIPFILRAKFLPQNSPIFSPNFLYFSIFSPEISSEYSRIFPDFSHNFQFPVMTGKKFFLLFLNFQLSFCPFFSFTSMFFCWKQEETGSMRKRGRKSGKDERCPFSP